MAFWRAIAAFFLKATALSCLAIFIVRPARSSEPKDREIKVRNGNVRFDKLRAGFQDVRSGRPPEQGEALLSTIGSYRVSC